MAKRLGRILPPVIVLLLAAAVAAILWYIIPGRYSLNHVEYYDMLVEEVPNPLMGYAPDARDEEACAETSLVYIGLTWADWEPSEGRYDITGLEKTWHLDRWREEGKHAVLRFIADYPGEEKHMDIPEWLYQKTGDGTFYSTEYGQGYAPDYSNRYLKERHKKAIEALAAYCNRDSFVAYVELGSLGHWGEWHTNWTADHAIPRLPDEELCWEYVLDYSDSFHNVLFLMRRNYSMVSEAGLGLYHDMVGDPAETEEWQSCLRDGGEQETQREALLLKPAEENWKKAPVGGELTSSIQMDRLLGEKLGESIEQIRALHVSFLGPNCPTQTNQTGASVLASHIGYRLCISRLETAFDFGRNQLKVKMTWNNNGVAPCYWDWPVPMIVYNAEGERIFWQSLNLSLSDILPGKTVESEAEIPYTETLREGYSIGVVITSPDEKEHIRLAFEEIEPDSDGVHLLYSFVP